MNTSDVFLKNTQNEPFSKYSIISLDVVCKKCASRLEFRIPGFHFRTEYKDNREDKYAQ